MLQKRRAITKIRHLFTVYVGIGLSGLGTALLPMAATAEALTYNFVNFPPFQYLDESRGDAAGITIDLLRVAADELALPITFQRLPKQRFIKLGATGQIQVTMVSSLYITPMQHWYYCSETPITHVKPSLYINPNLHPEIEDLDDLKEQVVYAPKSTSASLLPLLPRSLTQDETHQGNILSGLFSKERIGLVVDFEEHMVTQLKRSPPSFEVKRIALAPLDVLLCINKEIADHRKIHFQLEQAFLRAAHSDLGTAIFKKYDFFLDFVRAPKPL